jgi:hypothetical protein
MMKPLLILLLVPFFTSCSSRFASAAAPAPASLMSPESPGHTRKIKKTGSMNLRAISLKESSAKSLALVTKYRGTVTSSSLTKDDFDATIRVPSASLESLMDSLTEVGHVTRKRVSMDDITEQYLDLEAALKNKRVLRDRLRNMLNQTKNVDELLKVEEQLARVQTELDQMEARLKLMQSQVALSTLSLSIERKRIPGPVGAVTSGTGWFFKKLVNLN